MADVEKQNEVLEEEGPATEEEIAVEVEKPSEEAVNEETETATPQEEFYANLAEDLDERVLGRLSSKLVDDYKKDKIPRKDWETGYTQGLDLLVFKYTEMTRPFRGAANVTHPLLAEAVTQFQAQAYKELLPSDGPVRCKVLGDETQEKQQQADRVQDFMNYMLMEKMEEYTPEFDQLLFYLPLAGSAFKKIYYDAIMERAVSKFVPAEDLYVPYNSTSLEDTDTIVHKIRMSGNDLLKQQISGFYSDVAVEEDINSDSITEKKKELIGVEPVEDEMYSVLEFHTNLD